MDKTQASVIKTVVAICSMMALFVGMFFYTMSKPRMLSPKELVGMGAITFQEPIQLENFALMAHTGEAFTQESVKGQWTLVFFGFSHCPGFCPATLAILNVMNQQLEPEIRAKTQVVMISVDPARDTVERLAEYIPQFNETFVGVTGDFIAIKNLSNQFHIGFQKSTSGEENYDVSHGEQIVLINPQGQYAGFFKSPHSLGPLKTAYQAIVLANK